MDIKFVFEIFLSVATLLVLVLPCFILAKKSLIGKSAESALSVIVLYVCQPIMLVTSFQKTAFSYSILTNMLIVAALAFIVHGIMIAIVMLAFRENGDKKRRVLKFSAVFSNCGYMGIPFLQILYGGNGEILVYAGVVIGVFNILAWTVGTYMITGDKNSVSIKKALLNPNIIGLILGLLLFVTLKKPMTELFADGSYGDAIFDKFFKSLVFFSDMVTPLSMSVIGIKLSQISLKALFGDKTAYLSSALKLIMMSVVTMLCVAFLPIEDTCKNVVFFTLSMPSATMAVLLAVNTDGDAASATANVIMSTMLSVVTIPLAYMLFSVICI